MSKIHSRLTSQLIAKGTNPLKASDFAKNLLVKSGNMTADGRDTMKGKIRGEMTPAQRAISRQKKYDNNPNGTYGYNPKTNKAFKKNG
jgi:hypothetical protein